MILSLAIIINVTAALALIGGLAYAMSRAARLTPHFAEIRTAVPAERQHAQARRTGRRSHVLAPAHS
ncbi:MAG: hypothetical protein ACYDHN_16310 [Solirubrobacteraceae bacterium]